MEEPVRQKTAPRKGLPMTWIAVLFLLLLIVWMMYVSSQYATVKPGHSAMGNMNATVQATGTMPDSMPGMNH